MSTIKFTPEQVLKARGIDTNVKVHPLTVVLVIEAMKDYAKYAVEAQRDIMAKHLNMRNVPTPWTEK